MYVCMYVYVFVCLCECVYCVLSIISGSGSRCGQAKVCQKSKHHITHIMHTILYVFMYTCTVFVFCMVHVFLVHTQSYFVNFSVVW